MSISQSGLSRFASHSLLFCLLGIGASPTMADPPIELPPITVVATYSGGSTFLCASGGCIGVFGQSLASDIFEAAVDEISPEDDIFSLLTVDIPDNPNNSETGVTCNSDEEIRLSHAVQDLGPLLTTLDPLDAVRIHYEGGDSEYGVIQCIVCSVPVVLVASTCG